MDELYDEHVLNQWLGEAKYSRILDEFPDKDEFPLYYEVPQQEFTIRAGEMLFIPAGWFHFVFSEDPDPETRLNFAVNYWYHPLNGWDVGKPSQMLPHVEKHPLPDLNPRELLELSTCRCTWSNIQDGKIFPSGRVFSHFDKTKIHEDYMTFDRFYETNNPKYYMVQQQSKLLDEKLYPLAPKHENSIFMSSIWINFGNCRSLMHYDEHDNWLCQIQGTKRVILYPHEYRDKLYMFNPVPYNTLISIKKLQNLAMKFIGLRENNEVDNINDINYADIWKIEVERYSIHVLQPNGTNIIPPLHLDSLPKKHKIIDTHGHPYTQFENYPITLIFILDGTGTITFHGRRQKIKLKKGMSIIFPTHFTYLYSIEGNLKLILPE
jgi:quercetin dioxygenase-like cupin family protein